MSPQMPSQPPGRTKRSATVIAAFIGFLGGVVLHSLTHVTTISEAEETRKTNAFTSIAENTEAISQASDEALEVLVAAAEEGAPPKIAAALDSMLQRRREGEVRLKPVKTLPDSLALDSLIERIDRDLETQPALSVSLSNGDTRKVKIEVVSVARLSPNLAPEEREELRQLWTDPVTGEKHCSGACPSNGVLCCRFVEC